VGVFGVAVLLLPLGLARNAYLQALRLHEAAQRLHEKNRALRTAAQEASQGRKEERLILASELKNDVLPSLARVHLMGQVLKQDLLHGRLLQIDDDLPALLEATDAAHSVLKGVMQGLEGSPLGIGGVSSALRVLADQRESTSPHVRIRLELEDVVGSDAALHAVYEAAKEAIDNAVAHAHSSQIEVRMVAVEGRIRLVVGDNGIGFSPRDAYLRGHTGLVKMREIVESVGGDVVVVSTRGEGTLVVVAIPVDA
jgi:signal transduction histidine kinase